MRKISWSSHARTTPDSGGSNKASGQSPVPRGTPRLRRKKTLEERFEEGTSSRRLVEYFVVVSSLPRWDTTPIVAQHPSPVRMSWARKKKRTSSEKSVDNVNQGKRDQETEGNIHMPDTEGYDYTFQPKITARYPPVDYPDHALNPMVAQFCYPHSETIFASRNYIMPRIHHFVLTNDKGRKVYGTCLTIYEEYLPSATDPCRMRENVHSESGELEIEVTTVENGQEEIMYIPRVLCILSTWPYLTAFREYLTQLYRLATTTDMMNAPIERYIQNLCIEIPAPPPGAFEIHVPILTSTIRFWAPPAKLPIAYVALPYQTLFDCLDLENILTVWYALTLERKILLLSSQYSILTVCAEILQSLLFPMQWSHLYIPLVPKFLAPMLDAPFPYLCGVVRDNWLHTQEHVSDETIVVDLDSNTLSFGDLTPTLPPAPTKQWTKLRSALKESAGELFWKSRGSEAEYRQLEAGKISQIAFDRGKSDRDQRWRERLGGFDDAFNLAYAPDSPNLLNDDESESEQSQWDKVQEAFLRFFVSVLKDYRKFLHLPKENSPRPSTASEDAKWTKQRSFDRDGYIAWQKVEYHSFAREFCMTQLFDDFITKRLYSPGEPDVIFFDQSIDAKLNRSRLKVRKVDTPFLQSAQAHKKLNVVRAITPSEDDLGTPSTMEKAYMYKTWPEKFEPHLFCAPRPLPRIITAEFDRQSALVARLRANLSGDEEEDVPLEFYGGDYDPSPEVATFTVFFFTYSEVIGREWQEYQQRRLEMQTTHLENVNVDGSSPTVTSMPGDHDDKTAPYPSSRPVSEKAISTSNPEQKGTESLLVGLHSGVLDNIADCSKEACELCDDYSNPVNLLKEEIQAHLENFEKSGAPDTIVRDSSLLDFDESLAEYEEARDVASAQLDLAFSALTTMSLRGLSPDPDACQSLMQACGRCGDTERAFQLVEMMKREGLVTDSEVYASLMKAFSLGDGAGPPSNEGSPRHAQRGSDAYATYLKNKWEMSKVAEDGTTETTGAVSSSDSETLSMFSSDSEGSVPAPKSSIVAEFYSAVSQSIEGFRTPLKKKPNKRKKKRKARRNSLFSSNSLLGTIITDGVRKQIALGENLLQFLYPDLHIDTNSDSCPQCSEVLSQDDVVAGWHPCEFQDYTTACPQCKHRFVPRFAVRSSSPSFQGSQGQGTPLYCEFLSPWVLRQELQHVIHGPDGIEGMLHPDWRAGTDIKATLWWNLVVAFIRYRLPVSYLLQGSFQNRLINPTPDS